LLLGLVRGLSSVPDASLNGAVAKPLQTLTFVALEVMAFAIALTASYFAALAQWTYEVFVARPRRLRAELNEARSAETQAEVAVQQREHTLAGHPGVVSAQTRRVVAEIDECREQA